MNIEILEHFNFLFYILVCAQIKNLSEFFIKKKMNFNLDIFLFHYLNGFLKIDLKTSKIEVRVNSNDKW